jgi:mercuric ion binding protein
MKIRMLGMMTVLAFGITMIWAGTESKEKFKVAGNCGMCETRIEKAARGAEGVTSAEWDKETKMIEVTFNPDRTSLEKIEKAIAAVGHDTPLYKATDEVYEKLPGCCKYERME